MRYFQLLVLLSGVLLGQAHPVAPSLPVSVPLFVQPVVTGGVVAVHGTGNVVTNGTNLQNAYNAASCGSQIVLDAGIEYRGNFLFNKQCTAANWIQVVSANLGSVPVAAYVSAGQANNQNAAPAAPASSNLAKLTSGNGSPVLGCTDGSNHPGNYNYFGGLEVTNTVATPLVFCSSGSETDVSQLPDHIIFDRLYVHGITASTTQFFVRGFFITGSNVSIVNSYVADIYSTGQDTQAILFAQGPGPYLVHNNFLEGAAENILGGGTGATIGYYCTVSASPAPTTTTATVTGCVNQATGVSVASPPVGSQVMFNTAALSVTRLPSYLGCNGCGVDNLTPSGTYTGTDQRTQFYFLSVDGTGSPNTFSWQLKSGPGSYGSATTHVPMTACPATTALSNGVKVCWTSTTGHSMGGQWNVLATNGYTSDDFTTITANASGALTFNAIPAAPRAGSGSAQWGIVPADITITQNVLYKPPAWNPANAGWDGITRDVKDLLETKYGVRWYVNGNLMQHTWNGGQYEAWNINANDQNGDCPWCTVTDVTLTNNIMQDIPMSFTIIAAQSYNGPAPGALARVLIQNNLFWPNTFGQLMGINGYINIGLDPVAGTRNGVDSLQLIHNHIIGPGQNMHAGSSVTDGYPYNFTNLVIRDNLTEFDQYRWMNACVSGSDGTACINSSLNTGNTTTIATNAVINTGAVNGGQGIIDSTLKARYGSLILSTIVDSYSAAAFVNYTAINTDYHNFALAGASPFHALASDGTDPGVNFAQLDAGLKGGSPGIRFTGNGSVKGNVKVQ